MDHHQYCLALFYTIFLCFSGIFAETRTFIVRIQNDLKPSAFSDVEQWYKATLRSVNSDPLGSENTNIPQTGENSEFLHVYKTVFHGFSARLTTQQAQELKTRPGVLSIIPDQLRQIQTTRTPQFLGLSGNNPTGILLESDAGSNVIIGVFDTGIWPERRSFHDEGLSPVPSHWKGECTEGENFTKNHCNNKIIGARYFTAGYEASAGGIKGSEIVKSARDTNGHGTHTASTAAGRSVGNASLFGLANGVAVGVAPKARIAVYKICWKNGCSDSDILSAFDKAVEDGVDVISISVGGGTVPYHLDPISIGSFGAMERGILISASAGNEGPGKMTVTNLAPWMTTVGASTIDRDFPADLKLENGKIITGASLYTGDGLDNLPIIYGGNASAGTTSISSAGLCLKGSLDKEKVRDKIVICERGGVSRVQKGEIVRDAGGVGVIVANVRPLGEGLVADAHVIPGLVVTESSYHHVRDYINYAQNPRASISFRGTQIGGKPAPVVASFSSRGPSAESLYLLKPDIIAPGVNILAAWSDGVAPTELPSDTRRTDFNIISGTSMSCPHVSGVVALIKGAHPDWSPAMIRSALMTTAYTQDREGKPLLDEKANNEAATVWDMGAGHVDPEKAVDPGFVYDMTTDDYINFLCASNYSRKDIRLITGKSTGIRCINGKGLKPWDLNYPAISIAFDESGPKEEQQEVTVNRTAMHVSDGGSTYSVEVTNPKGVTLTVNPVKMRFMEKGEKQRYAVKINGKKMGVGAGNLVTEVGKLTWSDGEHQVVTPVVVNWEKPYF